MKVTKQIDIYLTNKRNVRPIHVVQYDTGVQLVFNMKDFTIPTVTTATLYVQKPSGKFVYQEKNINISPSVITIDLDNQAITEHGPIPYQVTLKNGSDEITTFTGVMMVEKSLKDSGATESKTVIRAFEEAADEQIERILNAHNLLAAKNEAANAVRGYLSGASVSADDVSPWEHTVGVWVHGKNLINPEAFSSSVTTNGVTATRNGDAITLNGTVSKAGGLHLGYLSLELPIGTDISVSLHDVSGTIIDGVNPVWFTMAQGDTPKNSGGGSVSAIWKNGTLKNATGKTQNKYLSLFYVWLETGAVFNNFTFKIQVEIGKTATDYEAWLDPTTVKVAAGGVNYTPASDGTVDGIPSTALADGITTNNAKFIVECEYNRDTNKVIEKLTNAITALGGTV